MWHRRRPQPPAAGGQTPRRSVRRLVALAAAAVLALGNLTVGLSVAAPPAEAASNVGVSRVQYPGTWYTYLKKGESLKSVFETSQDAATGMPMRTKIVVTAPDGTVKSDCEEVFAVKGVCEFDSGPVTEAGVWSVAMVPNDEKPPASGFGRNQMYWQVDAMNTSGKPIPGRVWTESFAMEDRFKMQLFQLWYQTEFGYTYSIDFHQFRGINSYFDANAFGNVNSETCASAYQSLAGTIHNNARPEYVPVTQAPDCAFSPDKIFFERPDASMPEVVQLPNGESTWLIVPLATPEISIASFTPDVMGSRAGTFEIAAKGFEGNAEIYIDTNGDGVFTEAGVDIHENVAMLKPTDAAPTSRDSTGSFVFDGRDGAGKKIPQNVPIAFRVAIEKVGEVHFLLNDVEELDEGIVVTRHNGLRGEASDTTVFWNDAPLEEKSWDRQAGLKCGVFPSPLTSDLVNGVPSAGKVRGWSAAGCGPNTNDPATSLTSGGSWGNNRAIDTWAFENLLENDAPVQDTMDIPGFKIQKQAALRDPDDPSVTTPLDDQAVVAPGAEILYSVTAEPVRYAHTGEITRPATFWTGRYSDDVTGVLDDATIDQATLASDWTPTEESLTLSWADNGQLWTWDAKNVPIDTTVTTSYVAVVKPFDDEGRPAGDGHLLNVAFAHDTTPPPPFPESCIDANTELCSTTEQLVPALRVQKSSDPIRESSLLPGESATYTLEFTNGGAIDAEVDHTDWLGGLLDDAAYNGDAKVEGDPGLTVTYAEPKLAITGTLAPGATATVTYSITVNKPATGDGVLTNFVVPSDEPEPEGCEDGDLSCTVHYTPSIGLDKQYTDYADEDHSGTLTIGDLLTYTFVVTNTGPVPLTDVVLTDPLLVAGVDCPQTQLAVGASMTCLAERAYEVTPDDLLAGTIENTATVTGVSAFDPSQPVTAVDTAVTEPVESVELGLSILKGLSAEHGTLTEQGEPGTGIEDVNNNNHVDAGDLIWYSFTVENTGKADLAEINVVDAMLADAEIEIECDPNELAPGEKAICSATSGFEITAAHVTAGNIPNVATATGESTITDDTVESDPDDFDVPLVESDAGLSIVKGLSSEHGTLNEAGEPGTGVEDVNGNGHIDAGDLIWYSFTVKNTGQDGLAKVTVVDPMLEEAGVALACTPSSLAAGESATCVPAAGYEITPADVTAGKVHNVATATGESTLTGTPVESDPDDFDVPLVESDAGLSIVKGLSSEHGTLNEAGEPGTGVEDVNGNGHIDAGDLIWYSFTVKNTGQDGLAKVTVVDPMLEEAGVALACTPSSLAAGESATCVPAAGYEITPADVTAGKVHNVATATGESTLTGTPVESDPDDFDVPLIVAEPALVLDKKVAEKLDHDKSGTVTVGDGIIWTFTATNIGNAPLTGLAINDPMLEAAGISVNCPRTSLAEGASVTCTSAPEYTVTEQDRKAGKIVNVAVADTKEATSNESSTKTSIGELAESGATPWPALGLGAGMLALAGALFAARGLRRRAQS